MQIRRFIPADAPAVSEMIQTTMRVCNAKDYPRDLLDPVIARQRPEDVLERAGWTHFYVAVEDGRVIGSGAIGPYWGSETESSLFSIFVLPEYQERGVGRAIIGALEKDEFFLRASRVEIPASITAVEFYKKMGYAPKPGAAQPDGEGLYRLEKHPQCPCMKG